MNLSLWRRAALAAPVVAACAGAIATPVTFYQQDFESGSVGPEWRGSMRFESSVPQLSTFAGRFNREYTVLRLPVPEIPGLSSETNQGTGGSNGGVDGGPGPTEGEGPTQGGGPDNGGDDGGDNGGGPDGGGPDNGGGPGGGPFETTLYYQLQFDLYVIDSWDGSSKDFGPDSFQVLLNGDSIFHETFANQHAEQTMTQPLLGRSQIAFGNAPDSIYRDITIAFELPADDNERLEFSFIDTLSQSLADESWGIDNVRVSYELVTTPAPATLGLLMGGTCALSRRRRS